MKKICRIITDHKIGNINPAYALAEQIIQEIPLEIEHIKVSNHVILRIFPLFLLKFKWYLRFLFSKYKIDHNKDVAVTIGNGSASIMPSAALSAWSRLHDKQSIFVQLQNPRIDPLYFDYVVAPMHDRVEGYNVIPTVGSLSRVKHLLKTKNFKLPQEFLALDEPIIAVFIGGKNRYYRFSKVEATELAQYLLNFSITNKVSLAITCSRRTGSENETILRHILQGNNIYFPPIETTSIEKNIYYIMLKNCKASIVTCDSVNMISDSIVASLQTFLYTLPGKNGKFAYFYNTLRRRNLLFDASSEYVPVKVNKFDETQRVARIIIAAIEKKEADHG